MPDTSKKMEERARRSLMLSLVKINGFKTFSNDQIKRILNCNNLPFTFYVQ